mmetsp:Transcript_9813/g.17754  ORF Transcript_9813/g.17754 Transcript_9813/m.17754 type:complete len:504 (+) Transcript_9813:81-1592(+)
MAALPGILFQADSLVPSSLKQRRVLLAACATGYVVWKCIRGALRKRRFPKVKGWPLLGVLPYIKGGKAMVTCAEQWAAEIGSQEGAFEVNIAGKEFVFVCSWDVAKPVFDARPYKVGRTVLFRRLADEVNGVFMAEGSKWRRHRQLVAPAFHSRAMQNYVPAVKTIVAKFVQNLADLAGEPGTPKVNLSQLCPRLTSSILISTLSGEMVEAFTDASLAHAPLVSQVDKFFTAIMARMYAPVEYWKLPGIGAWFPHCKEITRMNALIADLIERTMAKGLSGTTLLDKLTEAHEGDKLSKDELIGNVGTLFAAGTDTTASTLVWAFYELSMQPELQEELAREARAVLPQGLNTMEQLEQLTLAKAVWWESMRLHTPAPFMAFTLNVEVEVAGRLLPPGTNVSMLNRYMINNSEEMRALGSDLDVWRPKRWLDGAGGLKKVAMADLFFGHGARTCVGKMLAILEGVCTIAEVCRHFRIAKCAYAVHEVQNFTSTAEPDVVLSMEPR